MGRVTLDDFTLEEAREMLLYAAKLVDRRGEKARPFLRFSEEVYAEMKSESIPKTSEEDRIRSLLAA